MVHLAVSLLRALSVPARVVAACAANLKPPDSHAVVEAHDGVGWRMVDPTGLALLAQVVRIASGRDAADIAWSSRDGDVTLEDIRVSANA